MPVFCCKLHQNSGAIAIVNCHCSFFLWNIKEVWIETCETYFWRTRHGCSSKQERLNGQKEGGSHGREAWEYRLKEAVWERHFLLSCSTLELLHAPRHWKCRQAKASISTIVFCKWPLREMRNRPEISLHLEMAQRGSQRRCIDKAV